MQGVVVEHAGDLRAPFHVVLRKGACGFHCEDHIERTPTEVEIRFTAGEDSVAVLKRVWWSCGLQRFKEAAVAPVFFVSLAPWCKNGADGQQDRRAMKDLWCGHGFISFFTC